MSDSESRIFETMFKTYSSSILGLGILSLSAENGLQALQKPANCTIGGLFSLMLHSLDINNIETTSMQIRIYFTFIFLFGCSFASAQILDTANIAASIIPTSAKLKYSDNRKVDSLCTMGSQLSRMLQYTKGLAFFEAADSLENNNALIKSEIAWAYMHIPDYDKAIENFNLAITINPADSSSKRNIIICHLYQKKYDVAITKGKQYLSEYPNDPEGYYNLMTVYYYSQEPKSAIRFGKKSIPLYLAQKSRSVYDAYYVLGKIYYDQGDYLNSGKMFKLVTERGIAIEEKYRLH